jgi:hypothetical protein
VDLLRPRAVQALIASFACTAGLVWADCSALDGRYRFESTATAGKEPNHLTDLVPQADRRSLYRRDGPAAPARSWDSDQPRSRQKVTWLATTGELAGAASAPTLRFMDAKSAILGEAKLESGWACRDSTLVRRGDRLTGLGENLREERVEQVISRGANGELVHVQTVTVIDPPGKAPRREEARFPAAR